MRMRKKKNLLPRMERCGAYQIKDPYERKGRWHDLMPEAKEIRVELGCGKGRFTLGTAQAEPDVLFIAIEMVPDAMVVAMEKARDMGLTNVEIMIPFVRTVDQAKAVVEELARQGLKRGENGLKIIMMCEIPSNALLAEQFLEYFDGFSIGSNDMTQLALGLDRDSGVVSELFDERNDAVKALLSMAIRAAKKQGKYVGICGQGPSDHEDFAAWLMEEGIDSLSLNPDTVVQTWLSLAELKK